MDRRRFLQRTALTTAAACLPQLSDANAQSAPALLSSLVPAASVDLAGHTFICEFTLDSTRWKVYEDLRRREGPLTYVSSAGARVLTKSTEASFAESTPYLGLALKDIGTSPRDLLAERLLEGGDDPDLAKVKAAVPPLGSVPPNGPSWRLPWDTFVGTKECFDTMPVFPGGSTRTYHPVQFFPETNPAPDKKTPRKRFDGLVGGWMPAVRKVFPEGESGYTEIVVFGDVEARDKFIVQTWHRTARIENGKIAKVVYGYSYPEFPPARVDPQPEAFYRALLIFAAYWEKLLDDFAHVSIPDPVWVDMSKHAFAKELMVRPGGVYPKYGAVDRDYYGSEYDGFQDIFTSSAYANLECGRFEMAHAVIDNYFSDFVDAKGMVNMRGPETAQFGMTLSLLARYYNYTHDRDLLSKHKPKIEATAKLLCDMHDESLRRTKDDVGYGLIHGWSESDSCLMPKPQIWWLPYYANNAFTARGLRDLSRVWESLSRSPQATKQAAEWQSRSKTLQEGLIASIQTNIRRDMNPPYIGTYAGANETFWESMQKEHPSPQQWPHRAYAELLQADVLPPEMTNLIVNCMQAYGASTLGVLANVEPPHAEGRDILGFISYGYAQALLRMDRIEEFLLFLYSHRFHDHTRGSWTAGEVAGIDGDNALFCIPAQLTIPMLVRWMLALEDSDEDRLYLAKGLPREWVISGKEIGIQSAPTRFGCVNFQMAPDRSASRFRAIVDLERPGSPKEIQVKVRLPKQYTLRDVKVNNRRGRIGGTHQDSVIIQTGSERHFEISAEFS
jgi:hypothetical protein